MGLFRKSPQKLAAKGDILGLIGRLGKGDQKARNAATAALKAFLQGVRRSGSEPEPSDEHRRAVEPVRAVGPAAIEALIDAFGRPNARRDAADALKLLVGVDHPILDDPALRATAIAALASILRDRNRVAPTRAEAANALGHLRAVEAFDDLLSGLADHTAREVQRQCASSLGPLKDRRAVRPLIERLGNQADPNKGAYIMSLGLIGDPSAADAIVRAFMSEPKLEGTAVNALQFLKVPIDRLLESLVARYHSDPVAFVRKVYERLDLDQLSVAVRSRSTVEQSMGFEEHIVSKVAWRLMSPVLEDISSGGDPASLERARVACTAALGAPDAGVAGAAKSKLERLSGNSV